MSKGGTQISKLGNAIKKLSDDSKRITSFRTLKTQTESARNAWRSAEGQVKQLSVAMKNTANPTQAMQREFEKAKAASNRAKTAYIKQRDALQKIRGEMLITGQSTRNLAAQQSKLGASVTRLQAKYRSLDSTLRKGEAIKAKRSAIRGQIFDMVALGAAIASPVTAAIGFENAMADVKKVIALPDDKERADNVIKELEKGLKEMSRTIPISAKGLATIAASGAQLGVGAKKNELTGQIETNVKDLQKFVEIASKMAIAFDLTEEEAGTAMANLSNIFGIAITDMDGLGDAINHLSDNTAAKAKDIVKALTRVGGVGKSFGLDPKIIAALADSFIALGKAPEEAGTAINRLLTRLLTADQQSPKFQKALQKMGLEATSLKEAISNDAEGALVSFLNQLSKVEKIERTGIIFSLFGQQQVGSISALAGQVDVFTKALDTLKSKDSQGELKLIGSMEREFKNRSATTANQITLFTNSLGELGINMGATLLPAINNVLGSVGKVVLGMADLADKFPLVTKVVFGTIFALVALKIAVLGAAFVWSFVTGGAVIASAGLKKIGIEATLTGIKFQAFNLVALKTAIRTKALAIASFVSGTWRSLGLAAAFVKMQFLAFNLASSITFVRMKAIAIGQSVIVAWGTLSSMVSLMRIRLLAFNFAALATSVRMKALAAGSVLVTIWNSLGLAFTLAKTRLLAFNITAAVSVLRTKALAIGHGLVTAWGLFSSAISFANTQLIAFSGSALAAMIRAKTLAFGAVLAGVWNKMSVAFALAKTQLLTFNVAAAVTILRTRALAIGQALIAGWIAFSASTALADTGLLAFNATSIATVIQTKALAVGQILAAGWAAFGNSVLFTNAKLVIFNAISLITSARMKALAFGAVLAGIWNKLSFAITFVTTRLSALNIMAGITAVRMKAMAVVSAIVGAWTTFAGAITFARTGLASFNIVALVTMARMKVMAVGSAIAGAWSAISAAVTIAKTAFLAFNLATATSLLRMGALAVGQSLVALFGLLGGAVSLAAVKLGIFNVISSVTAIGLKALAFGGMIKAFAVGLLSLATGVIPAVIGGLKLLTVAFLTNPIGLIIGGIALAAGFLIAKWDAVKGFFASLWEPVKAVWQRFADWIGGFWKIISAPFTAIGKVFGLLFGSGNEVKANIKSTEETKRTGSFEGNFASDEESGESGVFDEENTLPQRTAGLQESIAGGVISNQRIVDSRTINNSFKIEVHAAPGQDEDSIADKVMRQIKDMSRGALFDTAGATL